MRCTWCSAEATFATIPIFWRVPACGAKACRAATMELDEAAGICARRSGGGAERTAWGREVLLLDCDVEYRDECESHGRRIDWTRPVEGWLLW